MKNVWMLINTSRSIDELKYVHRRVRLMNKTMILVTQLCHPKGAPNHTESWPNAPFRRTARILSNGPTEHIVYVSSGP